MKRVCLLSGLSLILFAVQAQQTFYDCNSAYIACSKEPIAINEVNGAGLAGEVTNLFCLEGSFPETNSFWVKWRIGEPGDLGFTIIPLHESDDIDFVLYKLEGGIGNCYQKTEIRCMASGKNRGETIEEDATYCAGATGLNKVSKDTNEAPGCSGKDNNFLASVDAIAGEEYALFINNYYSNGGFLLEFTGSSGFEIIKGQCSNVPESTSETFIDQMSESIVSIGTPFPNPAQSKLYLPIVSGQEFDDARLQVINSFGRVVKQQVVQITQGEQRLSICLEGITTGVYFLKTTIGDNQHIVRFYKH
ncbi:MAG: T9SS type A sorting domain-containing protein [Saprospirales bacterium]|nr:T9SS type A sorting domain-containing protein [Saprospirales bacterium]